MNRHRGTRATLANATVSALLAALIWWCYAQAGAPVDCYRATQAGDPGC